MWNQKQHLIIIIINRTKTPPELPDDYFVWVDTPQGQVQGNIVLTAPEPRSYHVTIPTGHIWRNFTHLRVIIYIYKIRYIRVISCNH